MSTRLAHAGNNNTRQEHPVCNESNVIMGEMGRVHRINKTNWILITGNANAIMPHDVGARTHRPTNAIRRPTVGYFALGNRPRSSNGRCSLPNLCSIYPLVFFHLLTPFSVHPDSPRRVGTAYVHGGVTVRMRAGARCIGAYKCMHDWVTRGASLPARVSKNK